MKKNIIVKIIIVLILFIGIIVKLDRSYCGVALSENLYMFLRNGDLTVYQGIRNGKQTKQLLENIIQQNNKNSNSEYVITVNNVVIRDIPIIRRKSKIFHRL